MNLHAIVKYSLFFLVGYSLWGGDFGVRFGLQIQVGSDDRGYEPGSGFSLKPV